jgi:hypothetical protein
MNTAQTVFTQGATTQQVQSVTPWIIGGIVAVALIIAIVMWER